MKLERSTKDYGGGSGRETFESNLFRVVFWRMSKGTRTVIEFKMINPMSYNELIFDGKVDFDSDEKCFEQLEMSEILKAIEYQKELSFDDGKEHNADAIRKILGVKKYYY